MAGRDVCPVRMTDPESALLISAARAWDAMRNHAGAEEGSPESRRIAEDVMSILLGADKRRLDRLVDQMTQDRAEDDCRQAIYERYACPPGPGVRL